MMISWDSTRKKIGAIKDVLWLIRNRKAKTRGERKLRYKLPSEGMQRRKQTRGEGKIEEKLISTKEQPKTCLIVRGKKCLKEVEFISNNFGIGAQRCGHVICDLLGFDKMGSPVCGEVKKGDAYPWSVVVQSAEQVSLLRADRVFFMKNIKEKRGNIRGSGAWGLIIAPPDYWRKKGFAEAKRLVEVLRRKTQVRICCTSFDDKSDGQTVKLEIVCGLPPYARDLCKL